MGSFLWSLAALVHRPKRCASDDVVVDKKSRPRFRFWRLKQKKDRSFNPKDIDAASSAEALTIVRECEDPQPRGEPYRAQSVNFSAAYVESTPTFSLRSTSVLSLGDSIDVATSSAQVRISAPRRTRSEGDLRSELNHPNGFNSTKVELISELAPINSKPKRVFDLIGGLSDKEIEHRNKRYCVSLRSLRTEEGTTEPIKQSEKLRFTCPYLKFDPKTYEERNCRSKSWLGKDIHRLKDHLYKQHRQKPHCHRCGEIFDEESQVLDHLMRPICCNLKPGFKVEGFSRKQEADIRNRKTKRGDTPEAKWTAIFGILFPGVEVPDPYYRTVTRAPSDIASLAPSSSVKFEDVFTGAIPSKLEKTARSKLETISGPLNDNQWREMLNVFKDFTAEGLKHLESDASRQALKAHVHPDADPTSGSVGENHTVLNVPDIAEAPGTDKVAGLQVASGNSGDLAMPRDFDCGPISATAPENTQPTSSSNRDGIYDSDLQFTENESFQDQYWGWMGASDECDDIFSSIPASDVPIDTNLNSQEGRFVFHYGQAFDGLDVLFNDWAAETEK